jgi:hypothetical protein
MTLYDIFRERKWYQALIRLQANKNDQYNLRYELDQMYDPSYSRYGRTWIMYHRLYKLIKRRFPQLTLKKLEMMIHDHCEDYASRGYCTDILTNRLAPLSRSRYNAFAQTVWEKRGSPLFGARKVRGAKWGTPVQRNRIKYDRSGRRYRVIDYRMIGVFITKDEFGKFILKLEVHK